MAIQSINTKQIVDFPLSKQRAYYSQIGRRLLCDLGKNLNDNTPTARFKLTGADKQDSFPETGLRKWRKLYNCAFDDHNPLAPMCSRIIDELLCNQFKRNEHK